MGAGKLAGRGNERSGRVVGTEIEKAPGRSAGTGKAPGRADGTGKEPGRPAGTGKEPGRAEGNAREEITTIEITNAGTMVIRGDKILRTPKY